MISLQASDFELFGLPTAFELDRTQVDLQWKSLQREAHPDRFASEGAAAQRIAMQWSVRINEAYQRLKDPLARASYLCELNGAPIQAENNTAMPSAFLIQQMTWRESLEDANSLRELEQLANETDAAQKAQLTLIARTLDHDKDPIKAAGEVRSLMFIQRFASEVETRIDLLLPS